MRSNEFAEILSHGIAAFWYNAPAPMNALVLAVTWAITGGFLALARGLIYFVRDLTRGSFRSFDDSFLPEDGLSASRLNSGPSSDGSSVTQSALIRLMSSFSRKILPRSP